MSVMRRPAKARGRARGLWMAAACSLLILLAGCAGDGNGSAPTPTATATQRPSASATAHATASPTPVVTVTAPRSSPPTASASPTATATPEPSPTPSSTPSVTAAPTSSPGPLACAALAGFSSAGIFEPVTSIATAQYNAATGTAPEHCEILGRMDQRTGVDGQSYVIRYRLRLPTAWNGKLYFQGGFALDGFLIGALERLSEGYAVVATDAGHDNATNTDPDNGGLAAFGLDPQARIDFGYRALDVVTRAAKALVARYFGRGPERSYFVGCSNGGRQGMVAAQRFPSYFDGIVAGAPGFNLPQASVAEAWNEQALAPLATRLDVNGTPYLPDTFSAADLQLVVDAILSACDALDGLADGIVNHFRACTDALVVPRLTAIQCGGAKEASCLSAAQITALQTIMGGPRNTAGEALYAPFPWDAGFAGASSFPMWSLGTPAAAGQPLVNNALNLTLGGAALPLVFVTPPVATAQSALAQYMFGFDFDADAPKIFATSGIYAESAMDFMSGSSTDRSAFKAHGGKLIIYHGTSDGVFSISDTIDWYDALAAATASPVADFVRVFPVPGLGHCFGGPATGTFDAFAALIDWVEHGVAPDRIAATAPAGTPWPGRSRPLCPYPRHARYTGSGSIEEAANFACADDTAGVVASVELGSQTR